MTDSHEADADRFPKHEPDKGSDRRQPDVAGSGSVATSGLQVIQKGQDGLGVYRIQGQLVNRPMKAPRQKGQEQSERVAVAVSGVRAEVVSGR